MDVTDRSKKEAKLAKALARVLGFQEKEIIALINADVFMDMAFFMEPALAGTVAELESIIRRNLENIHIDHSAALMEMAGVGVDWDLVNEAAESWAYRHAGDMITNLNSYSSNRVRFHVRTLTAKYFGEGMTVGELVAAYEANPDLAHLFTSEVKDKLGRVFGPTRAAMIAVTEITEAATQGELNTVAELGKLGNDLAPIWQTNNDSLVCTFCGPRHNKEIKDGIYPGYGSHPRCRCWVNHILREAIPDPVIVRPAEPVQSPTIPDYLLEPSPPPPTNTMRDNFDMSGVISESFKDRFGEVFDSISRVHGRGPDYLQQVPIETFAQEGGKGGFYSHTGLQGGDPVEIGINRVAKDPEFSTLHEIGHYIDHQGVGRPGFFTSEATGYVTNIDEEMTAWREALDESEAVKKWRDMSENPADYVDLLSAQYGIDVPESKIRRHVGEDYMLSGSELWARSYAQYITMNGGGAVLQDQLARLLIVELQLCWQPEDFREINDAIKAILDKSGF